MNSAPAQRLAVVIPACRPSSALVELVRALAPTAIAAIVIVDDGSGPDFEDVFRRAAAFPNVHLLRHAAPLGQGASLKTGINSALCTVSGLTGVVTVDAEDPPDAVAQVARALAARPECLIVGSAGLRGIPAALLLPLLRIESNGPEFKREMLRAARRRTILAEPLPDLRQPVGGSAHSAGPARQTPARSFAWLVYAVLAGALSLEAYGFATAHLFSQEIWQPAGLHRAGRFAGIYLAFALPVLLLVPWSFVALVAAVSLAGAALAIGPQALFAVVLFLVSACALGSMLLGRARDSSPETHLSATLLGIAVYFLLMTLLARLPVHYPAVWIVLLATPVLLDRGGVWRRLAQWGGLLRSAELRSFSERAACALLALLLLALALVALTPESSADGLAMHLAIPMNMAAHHRFTFDPSRFVWAVMPMGADFAYAIVYLLGGEYAAHLLNFAVLLLLEALLYCTVRRWVSRAAAFLILALFAATPLVYLVTGSLFVDNLLAAMVFGAMTAIWRFGESGEKRLLYLAAALGGAALAVKLGALAFVAIALPFAAWEVRRHWVELRPKPLAVSALAFTLFLGAALPVYAIAFWKTGNPLFPFLNQKFPSRLLDPAADIRDARFRTPLAWRMPFDLTFHTSANYEGQDGSFGFQYLVLAPLSLLALVFLPRRPAVSAAVVALGAATVIMASDPNARYLYAALPLFSVPLAAVLAWSATRRWLYRALLGLVAVCIALNAYFLPSGSYYHKDFGLRRPFSRAERERAAGEADPIRSVIAYFNRTHPGSAVLLTNDASNAGLSGDVYENHWHQYTVWDQLHRTSTVPEMVRLVQRWKIQYFIAVKGASGELVRPPALQELLERCTATEYEFASYYLARLEPGCERQNSSALPPPAPNAPPVVVPPGSYDDFDPAIRFRGDWIKSARFDGPYRHTISYTDAQGAEASLAFEGTALTYVFTKASNRGLASITIDDIGQGTIDLYSPTIVWRAEARFCCLSPGRHVAVIRVLGQNRPHSEGRFIDLDSFIVE